MSRRRRNALRTNWDALSWKPVDVSNEQLGEFDDSVFFGLEELDGSEFIKNKSQNIGVSKDNKSEDDEAKNVVESKTKDITKNKKRKAKEVTSTDDTTEDQILEDKHIAQSVSEKSEKKKKAKKQKKLVTNTITDNKLSSSIKVPEEESEGQSEWVDVTEPWGGISLHKLLVNGIRQLKFLSPTPIQSSTIPLIVPGKVDVVGSAETGSGKTLAFVLPILHSLMFQWDKLKNIHFPYGLILAPTRELAMQITSVINDVCSTLLAYGRRVCVVSIVGGMSEQKQRRQLCSNRPVHIIVATPGRLCEILNDDEIEAFHDLSRMRFLVVDEADRMVEDGHFPELSVIFAKIKKHEQCRKMGKSPREVLLQERKGEDFSTAEDQIDEEAPDDDEEQDVTSSLVRFDPSMLLQVAGAQKNDSKADIAKESVGLRQTLLYSATAIANRDDSADLQTHNRKKGNSDTNAKMVLMRNLPASLQQLMKEVGIQKDIRVISAKGIQQIAVDGESESHDNASPRSSTSDSSGPTILPQGLEQLEVKTPSEDKDMFVYYFLTKYTGRTLLFVNSIKTARRVDGLLRALGLNCRTIHSQLQQKQRLKALESFGASPIGILVATDVAARGLDIPMVQYVIHYDVARSPQVYIHRSGRTARAGLSGTTLSVVAPEDMHHHNSICAHQNLKNFTLFRPDSSVLGKLAERVKLAKKIFLQSFVSSQQMKQKSWLEQTANEADLVLEGDETSYINDSNARGSGFLSKKALDKERKRLKLLLEDPISTDQKSIQHNTQLYKRKKPFIVVAK